MQRLGIIGILCLLILGGGSAASSQESVCGGGVTVTECQAEMAESTTDNGQTATTTERIFEDDPRWDCRTMGNRICGPVELPHTL